MFRYLSTGAFLLLIAAPAQAGTVTYNYDALGRLKTVTASPGKSRSHNYDAAGNRSSVLAASTLLNQSVPASTVFGQQQSSKGDR